jgi:hypothetical protein
MNIASQKPYLPSPGVGSLRMTISETCSPDRRYTSMNGMKYHRWCSSRSGKTKMRWYFCGCSCVATIVAVAHIYRKDPARVTASCNRLGLSLSKCIRHGLIAKLNGKRRSWACKALDRISADYSHAHRMPAPIASPRHARPGPARQGERAHVCVPPFLLSSTHLQVHREQPTL